MRTSRTLISVAAALGLAGLALPALSFSDAPSRARASITMPRFEPRPEGKFAPEGGALLGAYVNLEGRWQGETEALADTASMEKTLGRKLDIDHHFYSWTDPFPGRLERTDISLGRIPLVSWSGTDLDDILNGSQDKLIATRAAGLQSLGGPVLLRWNWEMNGDWNPGGGAKNNDPGTTDGPGKFVRAWRHLHDLFTTAGATNVAWIWAPNTTDVPSDDWNHWTNYYPGDSYVDWVGASTYNWGPLQATSTWHDVASTLTPVYDDYATRKPFIVAETASTEVGGDKAAWIEGMGSEVEHLFPAIAALVWFNEDKETNWRIDSSASALNAFRRLAADPYFNTTTQDVPPAGSQALPPTDVPAAQGRPEGLAVPEGGVLLGEHSGLTDPADVAAYITRREQAAGRRFAIDSHDYSWTDAPPGVLESWDLRCGRIPMVTWRPEGISLKGLARGDNDARIRLMANALGALDGPVFLRFAPAMNGSSVSWSGMLNTTTGKVSGPDRYIAAWRHVHDVFAGQGVDNVIWVWSPDAAGDGRLDPVHRWESYYPGDDYVDWVGVNAVNLGTSGGAWQPTTPMVKGFYATYADRKPIMVAQTASTESGGSKARWLAGAANALKTRFPAIAAWVYDDEANDPDLRVDSSSSAYQQWRDLAQDAFFRPAT